MKSTTTWIVIADGARARVMQNDGPGKGVVALQEMIFEGDHSSTSEVMSDRSGRAFDSVGRGRHAMEPTTDPHSHLKSEFVREIASRLEHRADEFDQLILVAPPQALGLLRKSLSPAVAHKVKSELGKDLTHVPNADLPLHLTGVLAL